MRRTIDTSIRALSHPGSLVALGLLLLNDHVLKAMLPSTLTGKLSDFAGLVFFPFLVAIVLAPLTRHIGARNVGAVSIASTGAWFAAIKTSTVAAAATESLVEIFISGSRIVVDPTDLFALTSLGISWEIWKHARKLPAIQPSRSLLIGVFAAASIASSCVPPSQVIDITVSEGAIWNVTGPDVEVLTDDGWRSNASLDEPLSDEGVEPDGLQQQACVTSNPDQCYRIVDEREIQASSNGGNQWETEYAYPADREDFALRSITDFTGSATACGVERTYGLFDIAILDGADPIVVVAAGNAGVVTGSTDGVWTGGFTKFTSPGENIELETGIIASLGALMLAAFALVATNRFTQGLNLPSPSKWLYAAQALFVIGALALAVPAEELFVVVGMIAVPLCLVTLPGLMLNWLRNRKRLSSPRMFDLTMFSAIMLPPLGAALAYQRFWAWSAGGPRTYAPAVAQAGAIGGITIGTFLTILIVALRRRDPSLRSTETESGVAAEESESAPYTVSGQSEPWPYQPFSSLAIIAAAGIIGPFLPLGAAIIAPLAGFWMAAKTSQQKYPEVIAVLAAAITFVPSEFDVLGYLLGATIAVKAAAGAAYANRVLLALLIWGASIWLLGTDANGVFELGTWDIVLFLLGGLTAPALGLGDLFYRWTQRSR